MKPKLTVVKDYAEPTSSAGERFSKIFDVLCEIAAALLLVAMVVLAVTMSIAAAAAEETVYQTIPGSRVTDGDGVHWIIKDGTIYQSLPGSNVIDAEAPSWTAEPTDLYAPEWERLELEDGR